MNKTYTTTYSTKSTVNQKKCSQTCNLMRIKLNEIKNKESPEVYWTAPYEMQRFVCHDIIIQGGSNMTGTYYTLFTHKSVPVIFEPHCIGLRWTAKW
jgi:hypothetical protein